MYWHDAKGKVASVATLALAGFFIFQAGKYYLRHTDVQAEVEKDPNWQKGIAATNAADEVRLASQSLTLYYSCCPHVPEAKQNLSNASSILAKVGFRQATLEEVQELNQVLAHVSGSDQYVRDKTEVLDRQLRSAAEEHFNAVPRRAESDGLTVGVILASLMALGAAFSRWTYSTLRGH